MAILEHQEWHTCNHLRPKQNICVVPVARPCLILTPDPKHFSLYPVLKFFYVSERPSFFSGSSGFYPTRQYGISQYQFSKQKWRRSSTTLFTGFQSKKMWSHPEETKSFISVGRMTRSAMFSTDVIIQPTLTTRRVTVSPPNAAWGWMLRASNFS